MSCVKTILPQLMLTNPQSEAARQGLAPAGAYRLGFHEKGKPDVTRPLGEMIELVPVTYRPKAVKVGGESATTKSTSLCKPR